MSDLTVSPERLLHLWRVSRHDRKACQELLTILWPLIFRFLVRATRSRQSAEDLTQDTCLAICELCRAGRVPDTTVWGYVRQVAFNLVLAKWRKDHHTRCTTPHPEVESLDVLLGNGYAPTDVRSDTDPEQSAQQRELRQRIRTALKLLPKRLRLLLKLRAYRGWTKSRLAQALRIAEGSLHLHETQALDLLFKKLLALS